MPRPLFTPSWTSLPSVRQSLLQIWAARDSESTRSTRLPRRPDPYSALTCPTSLVHLYLCPCAAQSSSCRRLRCHSRRLPRGPGGRAHAAGPLRHGRHWHQPEHAPRLLRWRGAPGASSSHPTSTMYMMIMQLLAMRNRLALRWHRPSDHPIDYTVCCLPHALPAPHRALTTASYFCAAFLICRPPSPST